MIDVWQALPGMFVTNRRSVPKGTRRCHVFEARELDAFRKTIAAAREYLEWDGNSKMPNREGILLDTRRLIDTRVELVAALARVDTLERRAADE